MSNVERDGGIAAPRWVDDSVHRHPGSRAHHDEQGEAGAPILIDRHPHGDPYSYPIPHPYSNVGRRPTSRKQLRRRSPRVGNPNRRRRITLAVVFVLILLAALPAWSLYSIWSDWRSLERQTFDSAAFDELPEVQSSVEGSDELLTVAPAASAPTGATTYRTFMIVGLDASELRSDVIVMVMLPDDGSPPVMVSFPRDLYLPNRCTQGFTRINANFNGCGDINGATALSGAIKDFTGYPIDHFALFTFEGFAKIIDRIGGVEICVDHPTREQRRFDLPAGCNMADGNTALGWVRSRKTEELIDGDWRRVTNVSDLTRNERQQDLILTVFKRAAEFSSPQEMAAVVSSMADAFTLDDRLGMSAAIDLAWNNRSLDPATVIRPTIPVTDHVTDQGAQVLIPTKTFQEVLDEALANSR